MVGVSEGIHVPDSLQVGECPPHQPGSRPQAENPPRGSAAQFSGRSQRDEPPPVKKSHVGAELRFVQIGRGEHQGLSFLVQVVENPPDLPARDRVHPCSGLVEEEQLRVVQQRGREGELLFHASGQGRRPAVPEGKEAGSLQNRPAPLPDLLSRGSVEFPQEVEIFLHGALPVEAEALGHVAPHRGTPSFRSGEVHLSCVGGEESRHQAQQSGLARAVGADDAEQLSRRRVERDLPNRLDGPEGFAEPFDADHGKITSAGMPDLRAPSPFGTETFTRKTRFARSSG